MADPVQSHGFRHVRPALAPDLGMGTGARLTDRGLAVAMAVTIALVIAAVVCIATTAARVTAEPPGVGVTAVAGVR